MKYTHYLSASGVRGNVIHIHSQALDSQKAFERELGEKVVSFTRTSTPSLGSSVYGSRYSSIQVEVEFSDGSEHSFEVTHSGLSFARVFLSEHGLYYPLNDRTKMGRCAPTEDERCRIYVYTDTDKNPIISAFMDTAEAFHIIDRIEEGYGVTFPDSTEPRDELVTIPYRVITKATYVQVPFGGHE